MTSSRNEPCYRLVYVSRATRPMTRAALVGLLEQSRRHNTVQGITGLLVYRDDAFVQVLEGEQERVEALYAKIAADPRHAEVFLVGSEHELRQFPEWSMGFHDPTHGSEDLDGYDDVLEGDQAMRRETDLMRGLLGLFEVDLSSSDDTSSAATGPGAQIHQLFPS